MDLAKTRMYFDCSCGKKNWFNLDPSIFQKKEVILWCCRCGKVQGRANKEIKEDNNTSCCQCIPYNGLASGQTVGPAGQQDLLDPNEQLWGEARGQKGGKEGISRADYMKKYNVDPWTQWCRKNPDKPLCGANFRDRCKDPEPVIPKPAPIIHDHME
jgi:hypothetical protein